MQLRRDLMETVEGPFGLDFVKVPAGKVFLGTDKGGWIHASERPRHEVELPDFLIMTKPLSKRDVAAILGDDNDDDSPYEGMNLDLVSTISNILSNEFEGEIRTPSQSEWQRARENLDLVLQPGMTEFLADEATGNHRGAMMDGRPRVGEVIGPMAGHRVAWACHPKKQDVFARFSTPADRSLPKVVARLVVSPKREGEAVKVPDSADLARNIRSEIFWTIILGIIPSFTIPILRGFDSYAIEGWPNLLFGGLCAGFVTGAFWRPRRSTWHLDDDGKITRQKK